MSYQCSVCKESFDGDPYNFFLTGSTVAYGCLARNGDEEVISEGGGRLSYCSSRCCVVGLIDHHKKYGQVKQMPH